MTCRGLNLESDIDNVLYADDEQFEAVIKKYMATKNCKKDTALRWALQRAMSEEARERIEKKLEEYYKSEEGLI